MLQIFAVIKHCAVPGALGSCRNRTVTPRQFCQFLNACPVEQKQKSPREPFALSLKQDDYVVQSKRSEAMKEKASKNKKFTSKRTIPAGAIKVVQLTDIHIEPQYAVVIDRYELQIKLKLHILKYLYVYKGVHRKLILKKRKRKM